MGTQHRSGQDCACIWVHTLDELDRTVNKRVSAFCGAHHDHARKLEIAAQAGLYKIVPTACRCGGSYAWVRFTRDGGQEMIGCVCHTKIFDECKGE